MTKNNTISEMIITAMSKLHVAGHKSVTRTILWNALKDSETKDGILKRASLSSCITSLVANKKLIVVPIQFDVQHFALPNSIRLNKVQNTLSKEEEIEIDTAAEILLSLKDVYFFD